MRYTLILYILLTAFSSALTQAGVVELDNNRMGDGGAINLFEESGIQHSYVQPDAANRGGFLFIKDGSGLTNGFEVNGKLINDQMRVAFKGSSNTFFNTYNTGDAAVVLPHDAIASSEIYNESGIASDIRTSTMNLPTGSPGILASRSITLPEDGYIVAIASGQLDITHVMGASSIGVIGLSDNSTTFPVNMDLGAGLNGGVNSGDYSYNPCVQGVFEKPAGTHTIYLLGQQTGGGGSMDLGDVSLSLIYVPSSYGMVSSNLDGDDMDEMSSKSMVGFNSDLASEADIKRERLTSVKANQERMERELAELKEKIEVLQLRRNYNSNKDSK